ncbi:MAG: methyltransferase domain-containing protein [Rivularia sp. (in: Bacteria)]|nr:methyltransferase domain-containing protein [Rivularia sp. MS3]
MKNVKSLHAIAENIKYHLNSTKSFPLNPKLPLPEGVSESELFNFLETILVSDAPSREMADYCRQDFRRFVYTYGLVRELSGNCLELGANPYFTTILLQTFTSLKLTLANYFGSNHAHKLVQEVGYKDFKSEKQLSVKLESNHFNIEEDIFPYDNEQFDVVLFCEIIEHLLMDPIRVLKEIKRILKPNGVLILTTPNVSRLENVAKMVAGVNIYDPYSGYGPYGRHNREYNKHEIYLLLDYLGFSIDAMFSADVHENNANNYSSISNLEPLLKRREHDLGQYIFVRASNSREAQNKKPAFLYRSYPPNELEL